MEIPIYDIHDLDVLSEQGTSVILASSLKSTLAARLETSEGNPRKVPKLPEFFPSSYFQAQHMMSP